MKLERVPEYFITAIVIILGLFLALYTGSQIGSGNTRSVVLIVGGIGFVIAGMLFKQAIWLLIPICLYGSGRILGLPLHLWQAAAFTAFAWWIIFIALKKVRLSSKIEAIDIVLLLNLAYIIATFLRYPVGVLAFGSDRVGGAPYFAVAFAFMAYWTLCRVDLTPKVARWLPWLLIIGTLPALGFSILSRIIPGSAPYVLFLFDGASVGADAKTNSGDLLKEHAQDSKRLGFVIGFVQATIAPILAKFPTGTFFNPLYFGRCATLLIATTLILLSGFRSALVYLVFRFWIIGFYKKSLGTMLRVSCILAPVLGLVIMAQGTFIELPYTIQRSLSFVPAKWDPEPLHSAEDSAQWRYDMWEMLMENKRYLDNHWLGDGFGYSMRQYMDILGESQGPDASRILEQEAFILLGEVHSGPYSAIRYVGYAGLALFYLLLVVSIIKAHKLIIRSRGTPFEHACLTIGSLPLCLFLFFTFVYGAYNLDLPTLILQVGLLKLLDNGLSSYLAKQKRDAAPPESFAPRMGSLRQPSLS